LSRATKKKKKKKKKKLPVNILHSRALCVYFIDEPTCARTQCQCIQRIVCKHQIVDDDQAGTQSDQNMEDIKSRSGYSPPMGGIEERVTNLEYHLALQPDKRVPSDVYSRIQKLEERVLYLEGLSPEYFQPGLQVKTEVQVTREYNFKARQTGMLLTCHPVQYGLNYCCRADEKLQDSTSSVDDQVPKPTKIRIGLLIAPYIFRNDNLTALQTLKYVHVCNEL
jgi:hypothetical protein